MLCSKAVKMLPLSVDERDLTDRCSTIRRLRVRAHVEMHPNLEFTTGF